jgi:UDP-4-amino-4-deoxy-L-arabinose formyltransferase / UDP-glucuronic acid dehydrogenase (UDP-4-keto-hexauronic acid decarboxylating)
VTRLTHTKGRKTSLAARRLRVLIPGVNGFLGSALSERLLAEGAYEVHGIDLSDDFVARLKTEPAFHFHRGDVCSHAQLVEERIRHSDVVLPLMAVTTDLEHVREPLQSLELDLEETQRIMRYTALLRWVRLCAEKGSRLVLPSAASQKQRLLDRVIWAYGKRDGLRFSVFRPLGWLGPRLDRPDSARVGSSRVVSQLVLNLVEGTPLMLVDGGRPRRCFTDVSDGVECLFRIVEDRDHVCDGRIFNVANPNNELSIEQLTELLVAKFEEHELRAFFPPLAGVRKVERTSFASEESANDDQRSSTSIRNAAEYLGWKPTVPLETSVARTLDFYLRERVDATSARVARLQNVVGLRHAGIEH